MSVIPKSIGRYRDFINADYGHSFAEWLGFDAPKYEFHYSDAGEATYRMVSSRARGEFKRTKGAAKASYKIALANRIRW